VKVVVDSNVAVSGLLWSGPPNRILKWARDGIIKILGCGETTDEVRRVLQYEKFSERLSHLNTTPHEAIAYLMNLITFVPTPEQIHQVIQEDPFDNIFLALASENQAHMIISGDKHLLDLKTYGDIQIVTPSEAVNIVRILSNPNIS